SSSQKRLLAIARVFLKDTKVFLFDEIIETLDKENRTNIMKILKEKKRNHTIMIISRDKKILKLVDDIVLIDSGVLQAIGTHEELSKTNDLYKEIS
ncbi:MAG: ABC transporter ATP-binding protein, partial [Bacilli bacterium]|nr:ABC transporter ATP-binding protein [Bacilli bacterium]